MQPWDVKTALETMTILVDTREQPTDRSRRRLARMGVPHERIKLDFGDYSAKCSALDLRDKVAVERKMDLNELSGCFCQQRGRFVREFQRAADAGAKTYLLIENASIDDVYRHAYKTQMSAESMAASIWAWCARYNCQLVFCSAANSGKIIHDILYRELKERLEAMPDEEVTDDAKRVD